MNTDICRMLPEIETIVSKAMAKAPEDRYQSADEMRRALTAFLDSSRAQLSAIDSSAGATVVLPVAGSSRASTSQDFVPTFVASQAPPRSQSQSQPQSQAHRSRQSQATWWWAGGTAAAAIVGSVLVLGRPAAIAENPPAASHARILTQQRRRQHRGRAGIHQRRPQCAVTPPPVAIQARNHQRPTHAQRRTPCGGADSRHRQPRRTAGSVPASNAGAKAMFASTATNAAPGLRFRMILEGPDGKPMDVDPARDFHTGDRIKFAFESNIDGYLYVAQQGTSGNWTVLFPHPDINGGLNEVEAIRRARSSERRLLPLRRKSRAQEQIFVFLSREPMKTLPGFDRPVKAFETRLAARWWPRSRKAFSRATWCSRKIRRRAARPRRRPTS